MTTPRPKQTLNPPGRETDGLIQWNLSLTPLNFDRFHQPRLFTDTFSPSPFLTDAATLPPHLYNQTRPPYHRASTRQE